MEKEFPLEIATTSGGSADTDDEWYHVDETRTVESIVGASLGFADAVCGLITFTDGTFEVGVGECLRGYERLYKGDSLSEASEAWLRWCQRHMNDDA